MLSLSEISKKIDFKSTYKRILMILTVMLISTSCSFGEAKATPVSSPTAKKSEITWFWPNPIDQVDQVTGIVKPEVLGEFDFAKSAGFDTIYLDASQIAWVILNYPNEPSKLESFRFALDKMTLEANKRDLKVYGIIAGPDWATKNVPTIGTGKGRVEDLYAAVNYLSKWNTNSQNTSKLTGVTFDIEVYLLDPGNIPNIKNNFVSYLEAIANSVNLLKSSGLNLDITNSAYTDGSIAAYPNVTYNGLNAPLTQHLFNILNKGMYGKSTVTFMAYRPSAVDTEFIMKEEFNMIPKFKGVKINVAQETGDEGADNATSSYFGLPTAFILGEFTKLRTFYANNSSYGGFAIHHEQSYHNLFLK